MRAAACGKEEYLRHPAAVRPFQHVLDPLAGYLELCRRLYQGAVWAAGAWNFGPRAGSEPTVLQVAKQLREDWGQVKFACAEAKDMPKEATLLRLDSSRAEKLLGVKNIWNTKKCFQHTALWYKEYYSNGAINTKNDIEAFVDDAVSGGVSWAK
jgi:CDP-glucose 4,6-dehydratase